MCQIRVASHNFFDDCLVLSRKKGDNLFIDSDSPCRLVQSTIELDRE